MIQSSTDPGHICFDDTQLKDLRSYKNKCDLCQADLTLTQSAYNKCINSGAPSDNWFSDPRIVVAGMAFSLGIGVLIGVMAGN